MVLQSDLQPGAGHLVEEYGTQVCHRCGQNQLQSTLLHCMLATLVISDSRGAGSVAIKDMGWYPEAPRDS